MLIVFEGIDGTGKSTQVSMLAKRLEENTEELGLNGVFTIAEPTKSKYGKKIREIMMTSDKRLSFEEELDLFIQDRRLNVKENILPSLKDNKAVVLDRYYFSTAAYQGCRGFMDYRKILELNEEFAPRPDLVFFVLITIEKALERIDMDTGRESRSYMEKKENLRDVQDIFKKIHDSGAYNSVALDGTKSIEEIHEAAWLSCKKLLGT